MKRANEGLVQLQKVTKEYGSLLALDQVSLEIEKGENFGYIGPNGAGKTTTIKIMIGLISKFRGTVEVGGYSLPKERDKVHSLMGYLPQDVAFQEWRTIHHTLHTFGRLSGLKDEELKSQIDRTLELVDLTEKKDRKIGELSGGMIQRVGLAQALIHDPELLVLDEPLTGLDPASRHKIKKIIKELSQGGTTILFSSHILSDVQDLATKIGIIDLGRIVKIGTLDELKSHFSGANQIEVELSKSSDKWRRLKSIDGVKNIENPAHKKIIIHLEDEKDSDEEIHHILKSLMDLGCRVRRFNPVTPDLDEIYLKYVEEGRPS